MTLALGFGPPGEAVRTVALELADDALDLLSGRAKKSPDKAVHETRKRCKEIRAVLRLARPAFAEADYRTQNDLFRDASRILSPLRDAHAIVETFDELVAADASEFSHPVGATRSELRRRAMRVSASVRRKDSRIVQARQLISAGRTLIDRWDLPDDPEILLDGLHKIYRQGRAGLAASASGGDVHVFHDWRKRVKYLWYHVRMLTPHCPDLLEPFAVTCKKLSDAIGDAHDLGVLAETVAAEPDRFGGAEEAAALKAATESRQADLEQRALNLGARLYTETPAAFVRRIGGYMDATVSIAEPVLAGGIDDVAAPNDTLASFTADQLRDIAALLGVRGRWAMRKPELILAVRAATAGPRRPTPDEPTGSSANDEDPESDPPASVPSSSNQIAS